MTVLEDDRVIADEYAVAEIFNYYFVNITGSVDTAKANLNLLSTEGIDGPIDIAVTKYSLLPSAKEIKETLNHV